MKTLLAALLITISMPAKAEPVALAFEPIAADSFQAVDIWKDVLPATAHPAVLVATAGDFSVSMIVDRAVCTDYLRCPVRIYHHGIGVFDQPACDQLDGQSIDTERRRYVACSEAWILPEGEGDE